MFKHSNIFKFEKPKQFPKDEILDENERLVRGWMTAEIYDNDDELIPVEDIKKVMNTWMKRGAPIIDLHSNRPVGKGLNWSIEDHPDAKVPAIKIDYQIFKDYSADDMVWEQIKSNERTGLSLGGRSTDKGEMEVDEETGELGRQLRGMELYEVSSVDKPANPLALNTHVNFLAKSDNSERYKEEAKKLLGDLQKGFKGDVQKPFAGFDSFTSCVSAQREDGKSEESANRICGFLQAKLEDKSKQDVKPPTAEEIAHPDKKKAEGDYGPHRHDEENPEGLHTHTEDKSKSLITDSMVSEVADREGFDGSLEELRMGLNVEQEHGDVITAGKIAIDHLRERPDYYSAGNKGGLFPDEEVGKSNKQNDFMKCLLQKVDKNKELMKALTKPINRKI